MNVELQNILYKIVSEQGDTILSEPKRVSSFLSDLAREVPKPSKYALVKCLEHGFAQIMKDTPLQERNDRKQKLAQKLCEEEGLILELCEETLELLDAVLFGKRQTYIINKNIANIETPITSNLQIEPTILTKKKNKRKIIIVVTILLAVLSVSLYKGKYILSLIQPNKLELDEYNFIILKQIKNYDKSQRNKLALSLKNIKNTQKYIKENFPTFDFEKNSYITDDYLNELLIKDFNDNPQYAHIYLNGIDKMAGYSQVYSHLFVYDFDGNGNDLFGYYFSIDEEYSDRSGIEFLSSGSGLSTTYNDSLHLWKLKYSNVNEYYWEIIWDNDISNKDKRTIIDSFLKSIRYTKVFENIDLEWFKDIYTGIEHQKIRDIVE
jgi:hypothetical protein